MDKLHADVQILKMTDRSKVELNGVESVVALDTDYITLDTKIGRLYIDGEGLRIIDLSEESGKILISGTINELSYQNQKEKRKKGIFG